ncbi:MAG: hypothetical protein R2867_39670 [Caldilineaceae bacterium]
MVPPLKEVGLLPPQAIIRPSGRLAAEAKAKGQLTGASQRPTTLSGPVAAASAGATNGGSLR